MSASAVSGAMPLDIVACDLASESDRKFFEAHPHRKFRVRPARAGEVPDLETPQTGWAMIAVQQIAPGVRARFPFTATDLPPDSDALAQWVIGEFLAQSPRSEGA